MNDDQNYDPHPSAGPFSPIFDTPRLCHGCPSTDLESILRTGLRPLRSGEQNKSQWFSHAGVIGLTRNNAACYAFNQVMFDPARDDDESPEADALIIEVDPTFLDPKNLYPDEVYLGWANDEVCEKGDHAPVPQPVSLDLLLAQNEWQRSLETIGTLTHMGTIPREAITRYAIISSAECPNLRDICDTGSWDEEIWPVGRTMAASLTKFIFEGTPLLDDSWRYEAYDNLVEECRELENEAASGDRHAAAKLHLVTEQCKKVAAIRAKSAACLAERAIGVRVVILRQ